MIVGGRQLLGDRAFGIVLLIPAFAIIVGIILFPLLDAARLSVTSTNLINIRKQPIIGLRNYQQILTDPTYWQVVGNTFFITGASVAVSVAIGMALALALNAMVTVRGLLRALFIVPWLVPGVVIGVTWNWMLSTETGVVLWSKNFATDYQTPIDGWGMASPPIVEGDLLICVVGGENGAHIVAFDKLTGDERWRALTRGTNHGVAPPSSLLRRGGRGSSSSGILMRWCH